MVPAGARELSMNDISWDLDELAPETLAQAAAAAEQAGLSVGDYLAAIVLHEPPTDEESSRENYTLRHRIEAIERRFGLSVGGLDQALQSLDGALFGLAARMDENELASLETAEAAGALRAELGGVALQLGEFQGRLGRAEDDAISLRAAAAAAEAAIADLSAHHQDTASSLAANQGVLAHRIDSVENIAARTEQAASTVAAAQDRLQRTLERDLDTLGQTTSAALESGLSAVRQEATANSELLGVALASGLEGVRVDLAAYAEQAEAARQAELDALRGEAATASQQAEEALARLRAEFSAAHETLESQIAESAAETRGRMQAAFAENAARFAALSERVIETKNAAARTASQLRGQIADAEAAARSALEAAAHGLRQADTSLAHDISRTAAESRAANEALRMRLDSALGEVGRELNAGQARAAQLEAGLNAGAGETRQVRTALTQLESAHAERIGGLERTLSDRLSEASQARRALADDIARVETCTLTALDKLASDLAEGDEAAARDAQVSIEEHAARTETALQQLQREIADLRGRQSGAIARLQLIDRTLGNLGDADPVPLLERFALLEEALGGEVARLERAFDRPEIKHKLADLGEEIAALDARIAKQDIAGAVTQQFDALRQRLAAQEAHGEQAGRRLQDVTRTLDRLNAQGADAAAAMQRRADEMEKALASLRAESIEAVRAAVPRQALAELRQRLGDLEDRQANALETLRDDLAQFAAANERRLAAIEDGRSAAPLLENIASALETRLAEIEARDPKLDFDALRQRIEDRVLEVENRSVRALEQVSDTIASLERRFSEDALEAGQRSA